MTENLRFGLIKIGRSASVSGVRVAQQGLLVFMGQRLPNAEFYVFSLKEYRSSATELLVVFWLEGRL